MRHEHKKHFVIGGVDFQSNRVHGDFKMLHREFELEDPNPPSGEKIDWKKGTAMVLYVEKDKDGQFPEVIVDSMSVQRTPDRYRVEKKDSTGRIRKVKVFDAVLFYGCKKCTAKEFAKLVGIVEEPFEATDGKSPGLEPDIKPSHDLVDEVTHDGAKKTKKK